MLPLHGRYSDASRAPAAATNGRGIDPWPAVASDEA
jgi:hypothetical protein